GEDGKVIATLVNFACHPEIMQNNYLTADFPNWTYQRIEEKAGGVALFVNGALGGMVTGDIDDIYDKGQDNWDDAARIGNAVADKALEILADAEAVSDAPIALRTSALSVPLQNAGFEAGIAAGVLPDFLEDGNVNTEVAAGAIGRAQFATVPGEAFPNIGLLLKRWMSGDVKFVFAVTQDELGYIMSREDWGLKLYDYETSMSVGPEMGCMLVETLRPMIEEINAQLGEAAPGAGSGSLDAWFMALPDTFNADAAGDMRAVYFFNLTGEGGGEYAITIADGKCTVEKAKPEKPDLAMTVAASDMEAIIAGELDPTAAFMTGKLALDGDISLAMKLGDLFGL
ncbi:MAG: SCP2 sterol-binding domain-containing protein, partial [Armatimonadota bacterium]